MLRVEREKLAQRSLQLITAIINVFYFGLGVIMFVIGILYLTSYFYEHSFSKFNPTVVAGIFVPFGAIIALLALVNITCVMIAFCWRKPITYLDGIRESNETPFIMGLIIAFCSGFILILLIILLAIGIWGLSVYSNRHLLTNEVSNNMERATLKYVLNSYDDGKESMDWLQRKVLFFII